MKLNIEIDIEIAGNIGDNINTLARIFYPDEGNKIVIVKGLNRLEVTEAIHHEIGHLIDWYLSFSEQSKDKSIREECAEDIAIGISAYSLLDQIIPFVDAIDFTQQECEKSELCNSVNERLILK